MKSLKKSFWLGLSSVLAGGSANSASAAAPAAGVCADRERFGAFYDEAKARYKADTELVAALSAAIDARQKLDADVLGGRLADIDRSMTAYTLRSAQRLKDKDFDGAAQDAKIALLLNEEREERLASLKAAVKAADDSSAWSLDAALDKIAAVVAKACPDLPWESINEVAHSVALEDMAVKLGTTPEYLFQELTRHYKASAQNAISSCWGWGGSVIDMNLCLTTNVCRETGFNSCLCMTPQQKIGRRMCR